MGQVAPYHADLTVRILHRQIAPRRGRAHAARSRRSPTDPGARAQVPRLAPLSGAFRSRHGTLGHPREGAGASVSELLGGRPGTTLRTYASSMRRDIEPTREAARLAELRESHGFDAFKIRIGKECGHDEDEWPGRSEAVVSAVREALGEGVDLLVDANSCYTPDRAIEVGRMLEAYGVRHFEEPCPYWELEWTRRVTEALTLDVAGGEQDCELPTWRRMVELRAVDVVQPDVCYGGGLTRALRVTRLADEAGLPCTPHSANLSLVLVFTLHLAAAIENAGPYVELSIEPDSYYPWQVGLFEPVPVVTGGRLSVPTGPGSTSTPPPDAYAQCSSPSRPGWRRRRACTPACPARRAPVAGSVRLAERPSADATIRCPAGVPEWPKGAGCKPAGSAFRGSNPLPCMPCPTSVGHVTFADPASTLVRRCGSDAGTSSAGD